MEVSGLSFVGFWQRTWAAFSDMLFFRLIAFLIVPAAFRSDYLVFIDAKFATIASLAEGPIDLAAVRKLDTGSFSRLVGAFYFWLPFIATIGFWLARSATPGLMAIPARIVELRTAKKPSVPRLLLRFVASFLLGYTCGIDYLWIALNRASKPSMMSSHGPLWCAHQSVQAAASGAGPIGKPSRSSSQSRSLPSS